MNDKHHSTASSQTSKDAVAKVHNVAEHARSAATERVGLVRDQAESAKAKAAERVRKLGAAVRKIGEHMRIEEQFYIAEQASGASERLDSVASYIADAELGTLIRDAESLARRSPALVLGGTFLVGLAAGRVLKGPTGSAESARTRPAPQLTAAEDEPRDGSSSRASEPRSSRSTGNPGSSPKDTQVRR